MKKWGREGELTMDNGQWTNSVWPATCNLLPKTLL